MEHPQAKQQGYSETLAYLFGLQRFGIKLGLDHITALLKKLGNPHTSFPSIHIAGSNGKGSTAAFLHSILQQAGYRVGLYTSPHLVDFSERIQINGARIGQDRVVELTRRIRGVDERMIHDGERGAPVDSLPLPRDGDATRATITFFEFTTAMAFLYFGEEKVDIAIIEVGMGGRLDATNVLDPLSSLITSIAIEHREYLGNTLRKIAQEKGGIIKAGRPLFTTAHQPQVLAVLKEKCRELRSPCYVFGKDFRGRKQGTSAMAFQGRRNRWSDLRLGLAGSHQIHNASLALAGIESLIEGGWAIQEDHVRRGLISARWPGRLELLGRNPRVLLDGAHNSGAARVLQKALQDGFPRRKLLLVMGIMADKDIGPMMGYLLPLADRVILTRPRLDRAASLATLRLGAAPYQKPIVEIEEVGAAVEYALSHAGDEDLILITGSLFTVGEARSHLAGMGWLDKKMGGARK